MSKIRLVKDGIYVFKCPGCGHGHQVHTGPGEGPKWSFNNNIENPTFSPSLLVTWNEPSDDPDKFDDPNFDKKNVCHSFITNGHIQFLSDCTHNLAGQTVELPDAY